MSLASTAPGYHLLTATAGAFSASAGVTFGNTPSWDRSNAAIFPTTIVADGVSTGGITVTLHDANDRPVAGAFVSIDVGIHNGAAVPSSGLTDASGVFTSSYTTTVVGNGLHGFTVRLQNRTSREFYFKVVAGPADAAHSQLSAGQAPSDGATPASVNAAVEDAFSNWVAGAQVHFGGDPALTFSQTDVTAGLLGRVATSVTSAVAGSYTVTATVGGFTLSAPVVFRDDLPSAARSSLTLSPSTISADEHSQSIAKLLLRDAAGRPLPNASAQVSLPLAADGSQARPAAVATDVNGALLVQLTCGNEGVLNVTAAGAGLQLTAPLTCAHTAWKRDLPAFFGGGPITDLSLDAPHDLLFIATEGGVYRATTLSQQYPLVLAPDAGDRGRFDASCVAADLGTDSVYACGDGLLQLSRDRGWTWSASSALPAPVIAIAVDPTAAGTLFAAAAGGLYKSTDAGATFLSLATAPPGIARLAVGAQGRLAAWNSAGLWLSQDGGASFVDRGKGLPASVSALVFDPQDDRAIDAGVAGDGLWTSVDAGASWQSVATGLPANLTLSAIAIDPAVHAHLFAEGGGFAWSSVNTGATWTQGSSSAPTHAMAVIQQSAGSHALYGRDDGLFSDSLGFSGIYQLSVPLVAAGSDFATVVFTTDAAGQLAENSGGPQACPGSSVARILPEKSHQVFIGCSDGTLVHDGNQIGNVWTHLTPAGAQPFHDSFAGFAGAGLVAVDGGTGLAFFSSDEGNTWSPFAPAVPGLLSIAPAPSAAATMYALAAAGVFRSSDGGATWSSRGPLPAGVNAGALAFAVDASDATQLWLATNARVLRSADAGASWTGSVLPGTGLVVALAVDPARAERAFLVRGGALYLTADGASSWAESMQGVLGAVTSVSVSPVDSNTVYAGTVDDGIYLSVTAGQ